MTAPWAIARTQSARLELVVRGRIGRDAGGVTIRLQAADGRPIATSPADPTGHGHGAWVPFESRFQVSRTAREGAGALYVVALDPDGVMLAPGVQAFASSLLMNVGAVAVARPALVLAPQTHPIGNDGLVGGIVFGVPFADR